MTFVYWNLHKKCFSLRDQKTRKVYDWKDEVVLQDCTFRVSESGRQRVIREKKKNVHAGIVGEVLPDMKLIHKYCGMTPVEVTYNPYAKEYFFDKKKGHLLNGALFVHLKNKQIFAYGIY